MYLEQIFTRHFSFAMSSKTLCNLYKPWDLSFIRGYLSDCGTKVKVAIVLFVVFLQRFRMFSTNYSRRILCLACVL